VAHAAKSAHSTPVGHTTTAAGTMATLRVHSRRQQRRDDDRRSGANAKPKSATFKHVSLQTTL